MFSTRQAAAKLGLGFKTLSRYIEQGKVPAPTVLIVGTAALHSWTEEQIEYVRKRLPKIANGRKTRYRKLRDKQRSPAGMPVPQRKRKPRKKK
jgi:predicted DNA-binding transcriptional regulator AlpA